MQEEVTVEDFRKAMAAKREVESKFSGSGDTILAVNYGRAEKADVIKYFEADRIISAYSRQILF